MSAYGNSVWALVGLGGPRQRTARLARDGEKAMRLMDHKERIESSGLNVYDLVLLAVLFILVGIFAITSGNLLWGRPVWYRLDTHMVQVELAAQLVVIPLMGMLMRLVDRGRSCAILQLLVIGFFKDMGTYTVARFILG
jgi:hypothetical protein